MPRKTISIDNDVDSMLRDIQSKFIKADQRSWSLSRIVNLVLASAIINSNDLTINDWRRLREYAKGTKIELTSVSTEKFVDNVLLQEPHFAN